MQKVFVKPQPGVIVRREDGKPLAAEGEIVERGSYWIRRARDGDVTLSPVRAEAPARPKKPKE